MLLPLPIVNKHCIAKGEKAVAHFHRRLVGGEDAFAPGKGADQHNQGRARQVEVGDHGIHRAEGIPGQDKQIGWPGERRDQLTYRARRLAADSSVRTLVVPTATIRPPCRRVALICSAASGESSHHSVWI